MLLMMGIKKKYSHLTSIELDVFVKATRAISCDVTLS